MLSEDLLRINYKGQDYSLKELMEDSNEFSKSLLVPDELHRSFSQMEMAVLMDYGYLIAADKLRHLYHLLATARFALVQAHQKLHKSPVLWSSGYTGQLWYRSEYLKNAVIWYNSCDDYLLQIIWFAFDFFDHRKLTDAKKYKRELKNCRWESLFAQLENRETEPNIRLLLDEINKFRATAEIKQVREIANSLKHHADLRIKDLEQTESILVTSHEGFTSAAVANKQLDIDEGCQLLKTVHLQVTGFSLFLYNYIDFDLALKPEKGLIHLDRIEHKQNFKKFYITP